MKQLNLPSAILLSLAISAVLFVAAIGLFIGLGELARWWL